MLLLAESVAKMEEEGEGEAVASVEAVAPVDEETEEWAQRSIVGKAKRKLAARKGLKERRIRNAKRK